ncbi:hypothetical protein D2A34_24785 [Clostridium chromiireducens]|uniref:Uncharacterized protein n=1 Tax=Clostridium chromiireducens TaxID=225345 RepID=A0A399IIR9_9CLOT|nr:hypothetical protein [Clostridium chromiireducens]RII32139.1 hypothetical protein D2A34_24785 [Clostridium chromiireducens]
MNKLYNMKIFTYKKVKYVVTELDIDVPTFKSCCVKKNGMISCIINHNLKPIEKQNTLHRLIKRKKLRAA